ncbi:hypothetical protein EV182_000472 [Spiromyces aspiralis]|uniref:Uncharacterized protein n=1 Tax=Spiromyces aspiralis TaxID=68401 RepID=A0ACC1HKQ2_9FUNG|nr:hypothetical protein EV182_000472 [Spiromyces aspiralis]
MAASAPTSSTFPSTSKLDQDAADELFSKLGILMFLDAPKKLEFGIDMNTWEIGPLFKGIKLIPPGIHFIHYSTTADSGHSGMRMGFFHDFREGEILVKKWNASEEQLYPGSGLLENQVQEIKKGIRYFDPNLGAYQFDPAPNSAHSRWVNLISHVTHDTLVRDLPSDFQISSATGSAYDVEEMEAAKKKQARIAEAGVTSRTNEGQPAATDPDQVAATMTAAAVSRFRCEQQPMDSSNSLNFPLIDLVRSFPQNASPETITQYSRDKSWKLRSLLRRHFGNDPNQLLADLQLSFVILLIGQNFSAFEHWKRIVHLLTSCTEALGDERLQESLFVPFVSVLKAQLRECPQDFFINILSENNFISASLQRFVASIADLDKSLVNWGLVDAIDDLRTFMQRRFSWTLLTMEEAQKVFDLEEGDDAPVVVDIDG